MWQKYPRLIEAVGFLRFAWIVSCCVIGVAHCVSSQWRRRILAITLSDVNRFRKYLHCWIKKWTIYKILYYLCQFVYTFGFESLSHMSAHFVEVHNDVIANNSLFHVVPHIQQAYSSFSDIMDLEWVDLLQKNLPDLADTSFFTFCHWVSTPDEMKADVTR